MRQVIINLIAGTQRIPLPDLRPGGWTHPLPPRVTVPSAFGEVVGVGPLLLCSRCLELTGFMPEIVSELSVPLRELTGVWNEGGLWS